MKLDVTHLSLLVAFLGSLIAYAFVGGQALETIMTALVGALVMAATGLRNNKA